MAVSHIEHIGIAVKNLQESIQMYERILGIPCYNIEEIPDQKVRTAFIKIGQTKIELLESTDPEGPIGKFIGKKGEGVHHIAFMVQDLADTLKEIEKADIQLIDRQPRRGAEGLKIAFLHPKSTGGVLLELCEDSSIKK